MSVVKLDLSSRCITDHSMSMVLQSLHHSTVRLESLDLSFNQFFRDAGISHLNQYLESKTLEMLNQGCKVAIQQPIIGNLNIEKTGVRPEQISRLITLIPFISLRGLSLASLNLPQQTCQIIIDVFNQSGEVVQLKMLNLQNNRIGDKMAIALASSVFIRTKIEDLNLSQNGLGFKTGQFILNFIASCCSEQNKHKLALSKIELGFNVMSESLIDRIQTALKAFRNIKQSTQFSAPQFKVSRNDQFKSRNSMDRQSSNKINAQAIPQTFQSFISVNPESVATPSKRSNSIQFSQAKPSSSVKGQDQKVRTPLGPNEYALREQVLEFSWEEYQY